MDNSNERLGTPGSPEWNEYFDKLTTQIMDLFSDFRRQKAILKSKKRSGTEEMTDIFHNMTVGGGTVTSGQDQQAGDISDVSATWPTPPASSNKRPAQWNSSANGPLAKCLKTEGLDSVCDHYADDEEEEEDNMEVAD